MDLLKAQIRTGISFFLNMWIFNPIIDPTKLFRTIFDWNFDLVKMSGPIFDLNFELVQIQIKIFDKTFVSLKYEM